MSAASLAMATPRRRHDLLLPAEQQGDIAEIIERPVSGERHRAFDADERRTAVGLIPKAMCGFGPQQERSSSSGAHPYFLINGHLE
ncbi:MULTISPECIES: hypothetical protein [unclassified Bradyrhizobium]